MRGKVKRFWAVFSLALLVGIFCRVPPVEARNDYEVLWHETYAFGSVNGGSLVDVTPDGETIVAGHTYFGWFSSFLIFETDENGTLKWNRTLAYSDVAYAVKALPNGDILAIGYDYGFMGLSPDSLTISRFDSEGNDLEHYYYPMPDTNVVLDAIITPGEEVILVGKIQTYGGKEVPEEDVWILKLDKNASVKLSKTYDISQGDVAHAVALASNGDIIVAGESGNDYIMDFLVLRLDENGNLKWQKTFDKDNEDIAYAVATAPNGDIVVAGQTTNGEENDVLVIRLDSSGNIIWQKQFGESGEDGIYSITVLPSGDIVVAGYTNSVSASDMDAWILVLGRSGSVKWDYTYDGGSYDVARFVDVAPNGNVVVVGWSSDNILLMAIKPPQQELIPLPEPQRRVTLLTTLSKLWTHWFFKYYDRFDELYATALELGVDNETLENALNLHNEAIALLQDGWGKDNLDEIRIIFWTRMTPFPKLYKIREAYLLEKEAITLLVNATERLQTF
ncbi:hypothetical protein NF865_04460 [Thermococcus aggregans]|uniref:PQQ-binding-like beta-propeller repeat protein n=1 Tax=Thermococcus aggregans TaxID=110163 RepID=A0A9E7SPF9_THEAG|nr:hypothetical protein [Thermococcus aggregans]USS41439.1 hypothetical protein NF865_04460 [Thermococcus aggregans]